MASSEALSKLENHDEWIDFCRQNGDSLIDLTFATLDGQDLSSFCFNRCDFSGARITNCNLDGADFSDCIMDGTSIRSSSLVGCKLRKIEFKNCDLSGSILRDFHAIDLIIKNGNFHASVLMDGEIHRCTLTEISLTGATFNRVIMKNVHMHNIEGESAKIENVEFATSELTGWKLTLVQIKEMSATDSKISAWQLTGTVEDCRLTGSRLRNLGITPENATRIDLSGSVVEACDIAQLGPRTCVLIGTTFVNCRWPNQSGITSITGKYFPSPHLLKHPVQDVQGLHPVLRRTIADSQYLEHKIASLNSMFARLAFRLWGASSDYGQSLVRLSSWSGLVVALHTIALVSIQTHPDWNLSTLTEFWKQLPSDLLLFFGVGQSPQTNSPIYEQGIAASIRILGFITLGIWVGIAAQKLGRLSRE